MKNKVIVNGIDVFKDIEYKENLIQDLKDVISRQGKLLELYKEYHELKSLEDTTDMIIECMFKSEKCIKHHKRIGELEQQIKELENE